jgi:hypothetical protein
MWWQLTKNSDMVIARKFDHFYNEMVKYIEQHSTSGITPDVRKWLNGKLDIKMQWAACYTWQHRTYGVHSTQRAEAIHSAINQFCNKFHRIMVIVQDLENLSSQHHMVSEYNRLNAEFKKRDRLESNLPLVAALCKMLTPYAARILLAQSFLLLSYEVHPIEGCSEQQSLENLAFSLRYVEAQLSGCPLDETELKEFERQADYGMTIERSQHVTTLKKCSCQFPMVWGIPCRHILRLALHLNLSSVVQFMVSFSLILIYS